MLSKRNFTRTYILIQVYDSLLSQAETSSFTGEVYSLSIINMIEEYFGLEFRTGSQFNL